MKKLTLLFSMLLLFSVFLSCSSDSKTVSAEEEKKVIQQIDSISTELDKKSTKVKENTEKMKNEVDKLLDGI